MLFNSVEFLVFFPLTTLLYFALPHRLRWLHLVVASCLFYMAFIPRFLLVLLFTITLDYAVGLGLERTEGARRKWLLVASLAANLGVLFVFKYAGFAARNLDAVASAIGWNLSLPTLGFLLPIGLSFHTFQAMSYTIEVYRGRFPAEHHPGIFAVYVLFYPQLVAGPIERPASLLPQFREPHRFDPGEAVAGLRRMLWGMFKKVVVADRLALLVDPVYDHPGAHGAAVVALATCAFAFQIYCDFSGYCDIAIGAARVMGFRLSENFRRPYLARSVAEFWRRWHVSLSTWFRDYLYIPLGGSRRGRARRTLNLLVVFLASGLWHGASWTFVAWGLLHGLLVVLSPSPLPPNAPLERTVADGHSPLRRGAAVLATFLLVTIAWVFFRAPSVGAALELLLRVATLAGGTVLPGAWTAGALAVGALGIAVVLLADGLQEAGFELPHLVASPWARLATYAAATLAIFNLGVTKEIPFIYFQF